MKLTNALGMFVIIIFMVDCAQNSKLIPYEENDLWGYKNENGEVIIPAKYFIVHDFMDTGIAAVADSIGWKYIDRAENEIIRPYVFDNGPDYFVEDLARFISDEKFGFFNKQGKIVIPAHWDFARPYSNGMAAICEGCSYIKDGEHIRVKGGKWGFIDKKGEIIVPVQFELVRDFDGNHAEIKLNGGWKIIDKNGMFISNSSN